MQISLTVLFTEAWASSLNVRLLLSPLPTHRRKIVVSFFDPYAAEVTLPLSPTGEPGGLVQAMVHWRTWCVINCVDVFGSLYTMNDPLLVAEHEQVVRFIRRRVVCSVKDHFRCCHEEYDQSKSAQ